MAIDELADRPLGPDWLIDQTVGRRAADYAGLVPDSRQLLLDGNYALLRREFMRSDSFAVRAAAGRPGRILIALGAVDSDNVSTRVLEYLASVAQQTDLEATIIVGGGNRHADALRTAAAMAAFPVTVLTDISNMAEVMSAHDVVIGAGGTSAWERCALGLPALTIVLAENQRHIAEHLEAAGAAINLGSAASLDAETLAVSVQKLLTDAAAYRAMSSAAAAIADGHGCDRVLDILATSGSA
jgi:UDP-2,4-diacetamido-2,4,6-trideoxy-beta-L-altropyranose hydrolase